MKSVPKVSVCVVLENQTSQIGLLGDFEKTRILYVAMAEKTL